ncbi:MAG TPA: serine hydrolase domain-containing protein [Gemmatimonadaceae bacterium]|nr:serine hydrolase domain-containing protein [Gemmatimonadaceae bacterium]
MRTHLSLAILIGLGLAELAGAQVNAPQPHTSLPGGAFSSIAPPARFADPARREKLRTAIPRIDSLVRSFAAQRRVPGWAYGIVIDGRLEHVVAGGLRNVERNAATDTATVFRIASMSKSFAALAVLQLRDEGKLALDDPAERYVPELRGLRYATSDAPRITIRHLLTHSAGFPEDNPWGDQQLDASEEAFSAMLRGGIPFSNAPGTAYEYSNYGFAILGRVIRNVSGQPYAQYLRERILLPLGMRHTYLEYGDVPAERLAYGYRLQDGRWLLEPPLPDGAFGVMGGMLTTPADLSRWVAFMLDAWPARDDAETGPVKRSSVREMQQIQRFSGASAVAQDGGLSLNAGGYGYGLRIQQDCDYAALVSHTGGLPGYGSIMKWLPEQGVGIIALGSLTYTPWTPIVDRAIAMLGETGGLSRREPQPAPVLLTRRDQVTRLVQRWSAPLADSLAAMNLFRDVPADRRRTQIARVVDDAGGECRNEGPFVAENALRGAWRMRCARGDIVLRITLAPTEPAAVQFLNVSRAGPEALRAVPQACRR